MNAEVLERGRALVGAADSGRTPLPAVEVAVEAVVGNRLGAGVYRRWVEGLGLAGDERVVDIGSGAGACSRHIAAALPNGRLTCVEIDGRWLEIARARLRESQGRVEFVQADAAKWSRLGAFDVAIAHFVLHDIPSAARFKVLSNIADSLVPNGCLCLREPTGHGMSREELHGQLTEVGFELVGHEKTERVPLMGETVSGVWQTWW